jgi:hypothetical protein
MVTGRVFILESPNPVDLLENRGERLALEQVCRLVGHNVAAFLLRDAQELKQTFSYIGSMGKGEKGDIKPLFIHVSVHGNDSEIAVGPDRISWDELSRTVQQMYTRLRCYHGPIILILSACGASNQKLTTELTNGANSPQDPFHPPEYVFVFSDKTVQWIDAVVTWTIFYSEACKIDFADRTAVQSLLNRLHKSGFGNLKYYRWDIESKKYKRFVPAVK